ncbi:pilus assembly protein [Salmonella enterica]|uniref:Pilus assembly protein n=2 Tax=Salmonella enterica TaxID=28901 RepID=A0A602MHX4_SALET|nr:pilus assembly protein [Salmonella enterica]EAA0699660.1 pilus assembly protein [Salmonella enterica subsp. enterica serovar Nottingham]EBG6953445.1 pilus assembly protein [Salmonella enterica subsp. enterica]EEE1438548.1 pilus assembly protein [Salmonella enterica subsp. enterica serovar Solt]HAD5969702.1 pilus assembly protein [Salmonella enterica subsp. enterica serovar Typhimurium]AXE09481.1 pilus assembly protein [Salmonella enterica subsp. enterica serovar Gaminara str. SA20063285]
MKSIKKLIIASALSMMAASCYADGFLPDTEQQKSVDISFVAPEYFTVSLDQVPGLMAGRGHDGMDIAKLTVSSGSIKEFGARGISSSILGSTGSEWKITGRNSGKSIIVGFSTNVATARGPKMWNGETWSTFDTNTPVNIVITGDQDIPPDTYPLTVDVVGYRS